MNSDFEYNKNLIFRILKENKISQVDITFDGSNDSGQVDDISITPADKRYILEEPVVGAKIVKHTEHRKGKETKVYYDENEIDMTIGYVIEHICYDVLQVRHGGWEINDGSFGDLVFDVKNQKINLVFNERYMEVNTTESVY